MVRWLRYVRARYGEGEAMCEEEDCMTLLASIEQAICRAAGVVNPLRPRLPKVADEVHSSP